MWTGNQKAFLASLGVLATSMLSFFITGEGGPTDAQIGDFTAVAGEIVVGFLGAGLTYAIVWAKANVNSLSQVMTFGNDRP